ncbi:MAG: hypothetical protein ACM3WS_07635 [Bacillota bacterium]
MTWIAVAVVGGSIVGGAMSSDAQQSAANTAAGAQMQSAQLGIDEQKRQFDAIQKLLAPYVNAGTGSLGAYQDLLGLNGAGKQQTALNGIQNSPIFSGLVKQGENAILQNASATGGLRGGNVQAALAQFRPNLLSQMINDQFSRLGGLTSLGQNAAAGVGNAGMATGGAISNLLQQQGAAQAGAALAAGRADAGMWNTVGNSVGTFAGLGGFKGLGGASSNFLDSNAGILNQGLTPNELISAF